MIYPYSYITYIYIYIIYIYIYTNTVKLFTKRTPCIGCLLKWSHRAFRTALQELRELTNATVRDYHKAYYRLRRDPKPLEATCSEDLMNMHERGSCTTKCIIRIYPEGLKTILCHPFGLKTKLCHYPPDHGLTTLTTLNLNLIKNLTQT